MAAALYLRCPIWPLTSKPFPLCSSTLKEYFADFCTFFFINLLVVHVMCPSWLRWWCMNGSQWINSRQISSNNGSDAEMQRNPCWFICLFKLAWSCPCVCVVEHRGSWTSASAVFRTAVKQFTWFGQLTTDAVWMRSEPPGPHTRK